MEKIKILAWLQGNPLGHGSGFVGSSHCSGFGSGSGRGSSFGSGDGSGWGSGFGSGNGSGWGSGFGSGDGSGDCSGFGFGSGIGDGVAFFNGYDVFMIDDVTTVITGIHGSLAKGYILGSDFTLEPCYVVKGNGYFAHGETAEKANAALREKIFENMDKDEAIERFCEKFGSGRKYPCSDFYEWHHYLTGSCEMGRKAFMKKHDIGMEDDFTVEEFIALTENDYGGEVIQKLKETYSKKRYVPDAVGGGTP